MNRSLVPFAKIRILVTGSRGKSSLVRLILAGLLANGIHARGRITGVLPRELSSAGERVIVRNAPGHVEEMRWWLSNVSRETEAIVMENSAVDPQLQPLAGQWLQPTCTVWCNAREDHQEVWGEGKEAATRALLEGIPNDGVLVLGAELSDSQHLPELLKKRRGAIVKTPLQGGDYREENAALALRVLESLDFGGEGALSALLSLSPDVADFRVFNVEDSFLAAAFSANDLQSTEQLFSLLGWRVEETSLLYADRADRGARKRSFAPFLALPWKRVRFASQKERADVLLAWIGEDKRIFGCGNVAGAPLELLEMLLRSGVPWVLPNM